MSAVSTSPAPATAADLPVVVVGAGPIGLAAAAHLRDAAIAGDRDAAGRVELVLPETGVCAGSGLFDTP
ncbi:hypothetical protein ACFFSH_30605 [Streptomyces filamentosus]|uniref:FAD-dependent oxidoreductase n=1 Tax=Streptomyces filamentosus TaxID=67294 RepID=A0A919ETK0_STRFL|nr:hypothetical protein [Streptomyces filamentosus]KAA6210828.1 hypothetical protein CP979_30485 [Streptomyces filamentosus]GHG28304.1 hypothetical protein GCM10017667_76780 [Streptomyces filamentosus]